jgi:hypothetical protein
LGSALLVLFACSIEGLLSRYGEEGMGAALGIMVAFNQWDSGFNFLYASRLSIVALVAFYLARRGSLALKRPSAVVS